MSKKHKRKNPLTPQAIETRKMREREVRDVVNHLRKKYRPHLVEKFMMQNYFLQPDSVTQILMRADAEHVCVDTCSIIYKCVMNESFNL